MKKEDHDGYVELQTGKRTWTSEEAVHSFLKKRGIPKRYLKATLNDFLDLPLENIPETSFYVQGKAGTGKTHFICALLRENSFGTSSWFTTGDEIINNIRDAVSNPTNRNHHFDQSYEQTDVWITKYKEVDILAIDDFFMDKATEWSRSIIYQIINHRYNEMLRTYISSNIRIEDLLAVEERIAGRLMQMCRVVDLHGLNRRRK